MKKQEEFNGTSVTDSQEVTLGDADTEQTVSSRDFKADLSPVIKASRTTSRVGIISCQKQFKSYDD